MPTDFIREQLEKAKKAFQTQMLAWASEIELELQKRFGLVFPADASANVTQIKDDKIILTLILDPWKQNDKDIFCGYVRSTNSDLSKKPTPVDIFEYFYENWNKLFIISFERVAAQRPNIIVTLTYKKVVG